MSDKPRSMIEEVEQEQGRATRLFRAVVAVTTIGAAGVLAFFLVMAQLAPQASFDYMIPITMVYFVAILASLWLSRRERFRWAIAIYNASTVIGMFVSSYFFGGVTGPVVLALMVLPIVSGLIGGRRSAIWMVVYIAVPYLILAILETTDVIQPFELSDLLARMVYGGMFFATVIIGAVIAAAAFALTQDALSIAQRHSEELIGMTLQAEKSARSEREAREREERTTRLLRRVVQEYTAFLDRVAAGDRSARIVTQEAEQVEGATELFELGQRLNTTVESLVTALGDLEIIQRRYVRRAWEGFLRSGAAHRGFVYHDDQVAVRDEGVQIDGMADVVRSKDLVVRGQELIVPLELRGEVVGAIGLQREGTGEWADEEVTLVVAIVDQLTQTIESLRLLDETQRRAAREQATRQATAQIRETLDVEAVLQAAVREIRETVGIPKVAVRLAPYFESEPQVGGHGGEQ